MIRFLSIDIDGCLNHGTDTKPNLVKLKAIREKLVFQKDRFSFSLNSGRSVDYVRQYARLLSCTNPVVCENGGILYYPAVDKITDHPHIPPTFTDDIRILKDSITMYLAHRFPGYSLERGKRTMLSLNPPKNTSLVVFCDEITSYITKYFTAFTVTRSSSAVDISFKNIDKNEGLQLVLHDIGVDYSEVCAIGDSINDLVVLHQAGYPACPKNADDQVKRQCKYVATAEYEDGILEILSRL